MDALKQSLGQAKPPAPSKGKAAAAKEEPAAEKPAKAAPRRAAAKKAS
jgi:DNA end-binding protein Ku